jgi:hypothetical protein
MQFANKVTEESAGVVKLCLWTSPSADFETLQALAHKHLMMD